MFFHSYLPSSFGGHIFPVLHILLIISHQLSFTVFPFFPRETKMNWIEPNTAFWCTPLPPPTPFPPTHQRETYISGATFRHAAFLQELFHVALVRVGVHDHGGPLLVWTRPQQRVDVGVRHPLQHQRLCQEQRHLIRACLVWNRNTDVVMWDTWSETETRT